MSRVDLVAKFVVSLVTRPCWRGLSLSRGGQVPGFKIRLNGRSESELEKKSIYG
jgi:hypothetical protein